MHYFDYEKTAREARIPPDKLDELRQVVRQDFPRDDLMYELHLLRACMAIREGLLTLEKAMEREPVTRI
jgi:phosphopantetheinyl transferase